MNRLTDTHRCAIQTYLEQTHYITNLDKYFFLKYLVNVIWETAAPLSHLTPYIEMLNRS